MNYHTQAIIATLMSSLLLSGCQSVKKPVGKTTSGIALQDEKTQRDANDLKQCQKNLMVLEALQTDSYLAEKKVFGELMSGAAQYAGIRSQVNPNTQDTVDALYRYQVSFHCSKINQELLAELAKRGGAMK
ncbi:Uncharacterised protein [Serratia quinivorans]|uniref:hypothetical protein n=2 Tax=Serratia quinivorans TaxID=137545 RepID=UPI00217C98CE|nr:hypothetical protein [Serratia quinivorans]CAI1849819.1 Uncharacterised protein [Serratia quinivorans]